MKKFLVIATLLGLNACTNVDEMKTILYEEGYTDIEYDSNAFFTCGKDYGYKFKATSIAGKKNVNVAVCCGTFKGCTIRRAHSF